MKDHVFWWHRSPSKIYFLLLGCCLLNSSDAYAPHSKLASCTYYLHRTSTVKTLSAISKKAETYIKVKRLKQMISDGKGYQGYVDEMRKYDKPATEDLSSTESKTNEVTSAESDDSTSSTLSPVEVKKKLISIGLGKSDPVEVMKKVLKYQQDKINAQKSGNLNVEETTAEESIEGLGGGILQGSQQLEKQKQDQISNAVCKIAFLPDTGVDEERRNFYSTLSGLFYHAPNDSDLGKELASPISPPKMRTRYADAEDVSLCKKCSLVCFPMPDIFMSNTKRHEQLWMEYLRTLDLSSFDVVLSHGSSSEALLRYMESETVGCAVLIDASDIYTAGERHGRAFRYSLIAANCRTISFLSSTQRYNSEAATVHNALTACFSAGSLYSITSAFHGPSDALSHITSAISQIIRNTGPYAQRADINS